LSWIPKRRPSCSRGSGSATPAPDPKFSSPSRTRSHVVKVVSMHKRVHAQGQFDSDMARRAARDRNVT
jgi:hypothetical protein